jgi:hypothetical protein
MTYDSDYDIEDTYDNEDNYDSDYDIEDDYEIEDHYNIEFNIIKCKYSKLNLNNKMEKNSLTDNKSSNIYINKNINKNIIKTLQNYKKKVISKMRHNRLY